MFRRIFHSKFTAIFFAAFLCLNLSGSLCLAYCQVKDISAGEEHCPLSKLDKENCPMSKRAAGQTASDANFVKSSAPDCCSPAINVFAAKLEKHQTSFYAAQTADEKISYFQPAAFEKIIVQTGFAYQKPLYDHRRARLKNCVFRI